MYTNLANLQQTMLLQQKLFRQALMHSTSNNKHFTAPNLSQYQFVSSQQVIATSIPYTTVDDMEWKVKRRQDGSRYIVRRPVRHRLLRNRAMRINEERVEELTTEDDTISEVKIGRYWTKEERKKHMEKSRERRCRQELIISTKTSHIQKSPSDLIAGQKKTTKKKNNNTDDCVVQPQRQSTKLQQMPQPPSQTQNGGKAIGLLSVTTV